MSYAEDTSVPVERSKAELDKMLAKAGATDRMIGSLDSRAEAFVAFTLADRQIRMLVPLPKTDEKRFMFAPNSTWRRRTKDQQQKAYEQATRARWRAVVLLLKAKLEAIALGLSTPEREFLADLRLPNGATVHELVAREIDIAYAVGTTPALMLGPGEPH